MPLHPKMILKLAQGLAAMELVLTCHVCNKIIEKSSAVTVNCQHHVCKACAVKEQEKGCSQCKMTYWTKDIKENVCFNSIVDNFHALRASIERAAILCNIDKSSVAHLPINLSLSYDQVLDYYNNDNSNNKDNSKDMKEDYNNKNEIEQEEEEREEEEEENENENESRDHEIKNDHAFSIEQKEDLLNYDKKILIESVEPPMIDTTKKSGVKRKRFEVDEDSFETPKEEFLIPEAKRIRSYSKELQDSIILAGNREKSIDEKEALLLSLNLMNSSLDVNDNNNDIQVGHSAPSQHTIDSQMLDNESIKQTNEPIKVTKSKKTEKIQPKITEMSEDSDTQFRPNTICGSGLAEEAFAELKMKAEALGIEFTKKWEHGNTDLVIIAPDPRSKKPTCGYKILASVVAGIPMVHRKYLDDSYANKYIVDYTKYLCNYRQIPKHIGEKFFSGYKVMFGKTSIQKSKLQILLHLGGADVTDVEKFDEETPDFNTKRLLICDHFKMTCSKAKKLAQMYNCRVISQKWVIDSIYKVREDVVDERQEDFISEPLGLDKYDLEQRSYEDDETDENLD